MARNIINIEGVSKAFDIRPLLVDVSLGISEGERIGIVGDLGLDTRSRGAVAGRHRRDGEEED